MQNHGGNTRFTMTSGDDNALFVFALFVDKGRVGFNL